MSYSPGQSLIQQSNLTGTRRIFELSDRFNSKRYLRVNLRFYARKEFPGKK